MSILGLILRREKKEPVATERVTSLFNQPEATFTSDDATYTPYQFLYGGTCAPMAAIGTMCYPGTGIDLTRERNYYDDDEDDETIYRKCAYCGNWVKQYEKCSSCGAPRP